MSFEVGGSWQPEVEMFDYTYQGMQGGYDTSGNYIPHHEEVLDGPPTALKLRINGNDGWNFWKIRVTIGSSAAYANEVDVPLGTDHPNGINGASASALPSYWLDGNGEQSEMLWDLESLTWHIPERKPLYIRQADFIVKNVGQTKP